MKQIFISLLTVYLFASCKNENKTIVSATFVDSLIINYGQPAAIKANETDLQFWKNRIVPNTPDLVNTAKYASTLIARFNLLGDIKDVKTADSVSQKTAADFKGTEAGPYLAQVAHSILQHRFKEADSLYRIAKAIGLKKYEMLSVSFDINFELGKMNYAENDLRKLDFPNDYGYQFRQSKLMHYKGDLDSSISAMQQAVALSGTSDALKQAALSNAGDLYIHAGKLDKAYDAYVQCIKMNNADLHSIMGIGWIALVNDKNDSLAEKIFQFVATKTKSPEPLFKLTAAAEQRGDSALQLKYAKTFEEKVSDTLYGNMYNKYLIQLYTGILNQPARAEAIAKAELENRNTPQTNAWYVWALLCNNKADEAYRVYEKSVSGKPLEGLELYWMGKLMQSLNKGFNAKQFFKEAEKNRYDLSPAVVRDLEKE